MAENEDVENILYETLKEPSPVILQQTDVDGFQLQVSKSQKRAQKKMNQASKNSYGTRSKVYPKPFK